MTVTRILSLVLLVGAVTACQGSLGPVRPSGPQTRPGNVSGEPELRRLTSRELTRSLRAILGASVPVEVNEPDLYRVGFARVGAREGTISQSGVERLTLAVETAIDHVFAEPSRTASALGCDAADTGCAAQVIERLGRRAWRRPLTDGETSRLTTLAAGCAEATGVPLEGTRCAVSGLLLSPYFLYRVELPEHGEYRGYAMASRLAYLLWSAPPDDALLDAAGAGRLDSAEGVQTEARRMLADPRARDGLAAFVEEWFRLDRLDRLERDVLAATDEGVQFALAQAGQLGEFRIKMAESAREELRRLVVGHVLDDDRDYLELLSTDRTYVNAELELFYNIRPEEEGYPGRVTAPGVTPIEEGDDRPDPAECPGICEEDCDADCDGNAGCAAECRSECIPVCEAWAMGCTEGCAAECALECGTDAECLTECNAGCRGECEGGGDLPPEGERWLVTEGEADADGWRPARHTTDSPRIGLLGTMALLGQLGKQNETSPTRRGLYVMEHILCLEVGEPPDEIDLCERPAGVSRRDSIEQHHVCAPSCAGCHQQMDPLGFALDRFDTIGRYRGVDDWGFDIDSAVTWTMISEGQRTELPMSSLRSMVSTFDGLPEAERCVTKQLYRFATGHEEPADGETIRRLTQTFRDGGGRLREFLVALVATDAFRRVAPPRQLGPIPPTPQAVAEQVFATQCAPCHVGDSLGGLDLSAAGIAERLQDASSIGMPLVTPGSLERSYLWRKVEGTHREAGGDGDRMPPSGERLTERELDGLRRMIGEWQ